MKRVLILAGLGLLAAKPAIAASADDLLSSCMWVKTATPQDNRVDIPPGPGQQCWGYFSAIQTLSVICWGDEGVCKTTFPDICVPEEARRLQLIRVFVAFAERHPERLHEKDAILVRQSLREAFPCKDSK